MTEIPKNNPEKKEVVDDNDRKFTLETIDPQFLAENKTKSYTLITDWLETNDADETKIVRKIFHEGKDEEKVQTLLIAKITVGGNRTAEKKEISDDEYNEYLKQTKIHIEKTRYEFDIDQDGARFNAKYDEFSDSNLRVLEVGPDTLGENKQFKPEDFKYSLHEVSDDISFTGFRVARHIN
ncbi:hypothetical protein HY312_02255 [Candidatus Saccharibacteria bacterium]|nr:hypothetical protein [Candidatus Saccharibacteria bacterium]